MKNVSGEGKGGGAYLRGGHLFRIQQGRLIEGGRLFEGGCLFEGGRLFEEIRYFNVSSHMFTNKQLLTSSLKSLLTSCLTGSRSWTWPAENPINSSILSGDLVIKLKS